MHAICLWGMHPFLRVQKCTFIVKKTCIYIYIYKYITHIYIECTFLSSRLNWAKIKCICFCKGEQLPKSLSQSKRLFIVRSQVLCFQCVCIFLRMRRTSRMTSHDISRKYIYIHKLLRWFRTSAFSTSIVPKRQRNKTRGLQIVKYHEVDYNFNHPLVSWWEIATLVEFCK